ncbi:hypothetical protein A3A60_03575 [Candidatus Curtissbacteria bacterium RIFCSPLOWO2_01_FULL_42_26]|uniref:SUF system FeS cluster assembly SufBD core domain-containing protein n=1 Tax=Candidatus Curtissbacteria bacterium RIFCSPLOWO2_01_FULL_42_26 TaxID=1797729 RepID=A0A1F5I3E2_9BACT|nr:MAG: hypothetical protein A3A60_03575 [Candidatus Curtissbacteria bacterium RIFCSPLOWO2_01_FULL_42_26]
MRILLKKDQSRLIPVMMDGKEKIAASRKAGLAMTDSRLDVVLAGENASVEVVGLLMAKGERQTALEVYITHAAPNTKSNVNVRAVLRGKSTFAFRGNVKIEKGAKGADAYLRSDALLFDDAKMGDDTPALEILEPDVRAGHAATIGKVDERMLFYLMSRGLTRVEAEKLLVQGFTKPILERIKAAPNLKFSILNFKSNLNF